MNQNLPELNVALLEAVSAKIADEPENFDMGNWGCGTQRCIAGHAIELAGGSLLFETGEITAHGSVTPDGHASFLVAEPARRLLGLTVDEGDNLFYGDHNSVDSARRAIKALIESRQGGVA